MIPPVGPPVTSDAYYSFTFAIGGGLIHKFVGVTGASLTSDSGGVELNQNCARKGDSETSA